MIWQRIRNYILTTGVVVILSWSGYAKGIIIGNDSIVQSVFQNYSPDQIKEFARGILSGYDEVILHLGRKYPFNTGGFYSSPKSKENLALFCKSINNKGGKVYLWFLDSYGSKGFSGIYSGYREIIDDLKSNLSELHVVYHGVVIDMEWINRPVGNNNKHYLEILQYLKESFPNKKRYAFVSLTDDKEENKRRGFDENEMLKYLDNLIPMLYLADGGFRTEYGFVHPLLKDWRISQLKKYFKEHQYKPAYSMEKSLLVKRWGRVIYLPHLYYQNPELIQSLDRKRSQKNFYYSVARYKLNRELFVRAQNKKYKYRKGKSLFLLEPEKNLFTGYYFIWEYLYAFN